MELTRDLVSPIRQSRRRAVTASRKISRPVSVATRFIGKLKCVSRSVHGDKKGGVEKEGDGPAKRRLPLKTHNVKRLL